MRLQQLLSLSWHGVGLTTCSSAFVSAALQATQTV